ncbi:uncharacterized protein LOC115152658 [Salmo trutta]|uniref:uncharacterized protein LOC115152658 n=1 Tax=Salmo trutta TaxID=8032 RepID=UPI00113165BC|nr:uncharacterized protein LOC115152658 [Salmo trutta]
MELAKTLAGEQPGEPFMDGREAGELEPVTGLRQMEKPCLIQKRDGRSSTSTSKSFLLPSAVLVDEVHCTSVSRCAAVYAWGLHVVVWRVHGGDGGQQLAALVEVPQTCNRAVSLLGLWSSNHTDDFLQSDGKLMIFPNNNPPPEESLHPFGLSCNMPPIVTEPTVIRCKFKSTVHVQISTQDAYNISFSMLFPRPPQASVGKSDGILTWTPLDIQPVYLTIIVNDQLFSSQFAHILHVCNCLNRGTCQCDSIVDNHLQGRFQVVGCLWPNSVGIPPKCVKGSLASQECSASPSLNPRERQTSSPVDSAPYPLSMRTGRDTSALRMTSASLPSAFDITRWLTASAQGTTTPAGASLALLGTDATVQT